MTRSFPSSSKILPFSEVTLNPEFVNVNSNALFALDNENYLNLSKNMVDMAEYIQKLRIVLQTYETNRVQIAQ